MMKVKVLTDRGVMQRMRAWFTGMRNAGARNLTQFRQSEAGMQIGAAMFTAAQEGSWWTWQELTETEYEAARSNGRVEDVHAS
jgi:hypothetical protein